MYTKKHREREGKERGMKTESGRGVKWEGKIERERKIEE